MAFYRITEEGSWQKAQRLAFPPALGGQLLSAANQDQFAYPYNGWHWFDDDAAAKAVLGPDATGLRLPNDSEWLAMPRTARNELRDEIAQAIRDDLIAQGIGTLTIEQARSAAVATIQALVASDYTYRVSVPEG